MESIVEGAVTVPAVIVNAPVVVAEKELNDHCPPEPSNVRAENGVDVAMTLFTCVDVELKVTVPLVVNFDVDDANQFPASVIEFASSVKIELVAVPSWRRPVAR